jgi:predicted transcriptional regulator
MFAVFTPSGRVFSGSLEQLRRVEKTFQSSSTRQAGLSQTDQNQADISRLQQGQYGTKKYKVPAAKTKAYLTLLNEAKQREPIYQAYQVMSPNVQVILKSWTITEAFKKFQTFPYHLFPIVDSSRNLLGSLSRKNFYEFLLNHKSFHSTKSKFEIKQTISDCFLDEESLAYSAEPVTDVRRIIRLLIEKNLDALTIVEEDGRIAGIVSRSDILQCTIAEPPLSLWC